MRQKPFDANRVTSVAQLQPYFWALLDILNKNWEGLLRKHASTPEQSPLGLIKSLYPYSRKWRTSPETAKRPNGVLVMQPVIGFNNQSPEYLVWHFWRPDNREALSLKRMSVYTPDGVKGLLVEYPHHPVLFTSMQALRTGQFNMAPRYDQEGNQILVGWWFVSILQRNHMELLTGGHQVRTRSAPPSPNNRDENANRGRLPQFLQWAGIYSSHSSSRSQSLHTSPTDDIEPGTYRDHFFNSPYLSSDHYFPEQDKKPSPGSGKQSNGKQSNDKQLTPLMNPLDNSQWFSPESIRSTTSSSYDLWIFPTFIAFVREMLVHSSGRRLVK